ncbi:restriction endonuclease subunit S [Helicobacter pylori]|uniref:restriction endonuclease subunit S n=1 Tax=Helicobacter pylori TaxID=210 RepID=UPI00112C65F2|nr:restriction endonuclease subunit S [Helicobacter pylori]TPH65328.1 restriction endonuclease subunit S [Helicobacter pylori]
MNRIEKLLQTLAPKGVEFRKLGEVLEYDQPNKYCVTSKEFDKSYPTPVLTAGKTFILGYTNEKDNICQASKSSPVIIFDDFTTATQWVDFPFKVKSSAMKILFSKNPTINIRFIFFYMQTIPYNIGGEHARHWISRYSQLAIPIPPLEVQQEIVKILDAFTELNTELNTELKARKKQYEYYQNMLLDFNDINSNHKDAKIKTYPKRLKTLLQTLAPKGVEFRKLGEVLEYDQPNKYCVTSKEFDKSYPTPVLTAGKTFILGYTNEKDNICQASKSSPVIIFDDFTTATQWVDFPFKVKSSAMKILFSKNPTINIRFIFFYMQTIPYNIGGEHARHWISRYSQLAIPIPPLEVQQEIVKILDQFSILTTDLLAGIPAEIEARKKQYEYYREKLLTFKPLTPHKEVDKE